MGRLSPGSPVLRALMLPGSLLSITLGTPGQMVDIRGGLSNKHVCRLANFRDAAQVRYGHTDHRTTTLHSLLAGCTEHSGPALNGPPAQRCGKSNILFRKAPIHCPLWCTGLSTGVKTDGTSKPSEIAASSVGSSQTTARRGGRRTRMLARTPLGGPAGSGRETVFWSLRGGSPRQSRRFSLTG